MIQTEVLLPDRQHALVERLGLRKPVQSQIQPREVFQIPHHGRIIRATTLFKKRQRMFEERLGLCVSACA
jgi:hypothetical protein